MDRPIFFCHIPKTAGTALRNALESAFSQNETVPNLKMIEDNGAKYPDLSDAAEALSAKTRLFLGHYPFSAKSYLQGAFTVVILREPVARTVSHLKHIVARGNVSVEAVMAALARGELPVHDNLMTRYLTAAPTQTPEKLPMRTDMTDYVRSIAALESADLLGITERMDIVRHQLDAVGVSFDDDRRFNEAAIIDLPLDDKHLSTIRRFNQIDMRVYDYACELLGLDDMPSSVVAA